MQGYHHIMDTN